MASVTGPVQESPALQKQEIIVYGNIKDMQGWPNFQSQDVFKCDSLSVMSGLDQIKQAWYKDTSSPLLLLHLKEEEKKKPIKLYSRLWMPIQKSEPLDWSIMSRL